MDWERWIVAAVVIAVTLVVAKLADRAIIRRLELPPEALTRYRVLRRSVVAAIVALGVLSALLLIPAVRAVAGGVLASSAVIGLVIGFAARSTLANFVAGVLIAFAQPFRLGDRIEVGGTAAGSVAAGVVEEIGLTYTVIRAEEGDRLFVPNEKLASDTIRNATLAGSESLAEVTIPVPLATDLDRVLAILVEEAEGAPEAMSEKTPVATVSDFHAESSLALVKVRAWARDNATAGALAGAIRKGAHRRLRAEGIYA
ncbi:MAG TPA: mechanosensitive ion channel domain-containing protein [Gaiellaceae bacterium]|nr:mechanosensitive ion channel domain-containing protein [Gaiellaceae bacterium]